MYEKLLLEEYLRLERSHFSDKKDIKRWWNCLKFLYLHFWFHDDRSRCKNIFDAEIIAFVKKYKDSPEIPKWWKMFFIGEMYDINDFSSKGKDPLMVAEELLVFDMMYNNDMYKNKFFDMKLSNDALLERLMVATDIDILSTPLKYVVNVIQYLSRLNKLDADILHLYSETVKILAEACIENENKLEYEELMVMNKKPLSPDRMMKHPYTQLLWNKI